MVIEIKGITVRQVRQSFGVWCREVTLAGEAGDVNRLRELAAVRLAGNLELRAASSDLNLPEPNLIPLLAATDRLLTRNEIISRAINGPEKVWELDRLEIGVDPSTGQRLKLIRNEDDSDPYSGPVVFTVEHDV